MHAADALFELEQIRLEVAHAIQSLLGAGELHRVPRLELRLNALDAAMDAVIRWKKATHG